MAALQKVSIVDLSQWLILGRREGNVSALEDRPMIHNDPLRTIDINAIEREARRLRAEAFAGMIRSLANWMRGKTASAPKSAGQTA
jgi:hypothetical protein